MVRHAWIGLLAVGSVLGIGCESKTPPRAEEPKPAIATVSVPPASPKPDDKPGAAAAAAPAAADTKAPIPRALLNPEGATEKAPDKFKAKFATTKGDFVIEVTRAWAPLGADRFYNLVKLGYFDDAAFFRVVQGFVVQFGIHGRPEVASAWRSAQFKDDPAKQSNKRGTITFATSGPDSRTTQLFISFGDNSRLDKMGFSPFGQVTQGMEVVDSLYAGYGEGMPRGQGPDQSMIQMQGNNYLRREFPKLDYVKTATIVK